MALRVAVGGLNHETNTFASTPTTLEDFRLGTVTPDFAGGQAVVDHFRGSRSTMGGFLEEAQRQGWETPATLWTFAQPGGTVRQDAYEFLKGRLLEQLRAAGKLDAVYLDLHGAMVCEKIEDAEGDLLGAVRALVGPRVPIVATLDLHGNVTAEMARHATVLIGFDEYPHSDVYDRGLEAGRVLAEILAGRLEPVLEWRQLPFLTLPPMQCTLREPMRSILEHARAVERAPGIVNVSLILGFPCADIRDAGMSVLVTAHRDRELARRTARELAAYIWERRRTFTPVLTPVSEAIAYARQAQGTVLFADGSDNPGGGGPCDGTVILRALLEAQVPGSTVVAIYDPQAVQQALAAGVGQSVTLDVGGKTDDRHGAPVRLTARVKLLSDGEYMRRGPMGGGLSDSFGRTAVLVSGKVETVISERRKQPLDAAFPRSLGIEPAQRRIVALKSSVHFRSTYQELAEKIFDMDTPGVHRPDFSCYTYRRLRRPVFPLDEETRFENA